MIAKLVIASLLAGTSTVSSGQDAPRTADGAATVEPQIHQCTLAPVSNFAINTKGTGAQSGRSPIAEITITRIDLQVTGSPGGSPTITAHAINTKGTGTSSGRSINEIGIAVKSKRTSAAQLNRSPIGVACVTSQPIGKTAGGKASYSDIHFTSRGAKSVGWSCSVSGSEDQPVFVVGLLVPTILGQAERASFSWGVSNSGRVSIVPRGAAPRGSESFACASTQPSMGNYDMAMNLRL